MTSSLFLYNRYLHFVGLGMVAIGLPLSKALLSIGGVVLSANWLLSFIPEGWAGKLTRASRNKGGLVVVALYLIHLVGLIHTTEWDYALDDLRVKLPLLFFPLVIATMPLSSKGVRVLLGLFSGGVLVATIVGFLAYMGGLPEKSGNPLAYFVSHIRLGLMIALAVIIVGWFAWREGGRLSWFLSVVILWFLFYLGILAVMSAFLGLLGAIWVLLLRERKRARNSHWKRILLLGTVGGPLLVLGYVSWRVQEHFQVKADPLNDKSELVQKTENGTPYRHHPKRQELENGYFVWLYIADKELRKSWNRRSEFPLDSTDRKGQELKRTLIRYLTAKGLKKDSAGVAALSEEDVRAVENGVASVKYRNKDPLTRRVDQLIFEVDRYLKGHDPSGNSLTQRFEYWRAGWGILKENPWTGVGTGDIKKAFEDEYREIDSPLDPEYRLRAHNQYFTFWLTFGPVGFFVFLVALFCPPWYFQRFRSPLFLAFFVIVLISFLSEDTLETQVGVTFFVFFHCVLGMKKEEEKA